MPWSAQAQSLPHPPGPSSWWPPYSHKPGHLGGSPCSCITAAVQGGPWSQVRRGLRQAGKLPRSACQGMHTGTERGTQALELNHNHHRPGENLERRCREHPCGMGPWWGGSRGPGARAFSAAGFLWLLGLRSALGRSPGGFQGLKSRRCLAPVCSRKEACPVSRGHLNSFTPDSDAPTAPPPSHLRCINLPPAKTL